MTILDGSNEFNTDLTFLNFVWKLAVWFGSGHGCGIEYLPHRNFLWNHSGKFKVLGIEFDLGCPNKVINNFHTKLRKVKSVLNSCIHREFYDEVSIRCHNHAQNQTKQPVFCLSWLSNQHSHQIYQIFVNIFPQTLDHLLKFFNFLTEDDTHKCEGAFSKEECLKALKNMKNNRTPGLDGFTSEF
jgi:hypothetical protein